MTKHLIAITAILLVVPYSRVSGQALDIGGVELTLGEDVSDALRSLSTYDVRYNESIKAWFVSQKSGEDAEWLGNFSASSGRVSFISKAYALPKTGDMVRVYSGALRDAQRRGGQSCQTAPVEFTDDLIHQIETRCGRYRLIFYLADKLATGDLVASGISVNLGQR